MKAIKILQKNAKDIEDALREVNGKAHKHAYTTYREIEKCMLTAQAELNLLLYPKDHIGARWVKTSGNHVARASRNMQEATTITLERRSTGWFLVELCAVQIGVSGGGYGQIYLTPDQERAAYERLSKQFLVYAPVESDEIKSVKQRRVNPLSSLQRLAIPKKCLTV